MTARAPLVVGAGTMTGVRCYLDVDPDELREALRPLGPIELRGPGRRQVCCELWRVSDGRVLLGGLEQDEWARAARELGGIVGGFWGASMSWAYGALSGVARGAEGAARAVRDGARAGAARAGDFLARQAVGLTRWTIIEPYHELLLSVPDAMLPGRAEPISVVLGMVTDLPLAYHLDRLAYYGYDKRIAEFETDARHRWDVSVDGAPFVSARFEPTGREEAEIDRAGAASGTVQPLLGGLRDRRPMFAELRRDLAATGEEIHEVEGTVELSQALFPALRLGAHRVRSRKAPPTRVSVGFRGVEAFVTYPRAPGR